MWSKYFPPPSQGENSRGADEPDSAEQAGEPGQGGGGGAEGEAGAAQQGAGRAAPEGHRVGQVHTAAHHLPVRPLGQRFAASTF